MSNEEIKEVNAEKTDVDVASGETTETTSPEISANEVGVDTPTTPEQTDEEKLQEVLFNILTTVYKVSRFPSEAPQVTGDSLNNIFEQYVVAVKEVKAVELTPIQQAWVDDLGTLFKRAPELIHSLNLLAYVTETQEPNLDNALSQAQWFAQLISRQEGVQFCPVRLPYDNIAIVKNDNQKEVLGIMKKVNLLLQTMEMEDIGTSELLNQCYFPIFIHLIYPIFALYMGEEVDLKRFFDAPALILPIRAKRYRQYVEGTKTEEETSSLEALLYTDNGENTEEEVATSEDTEDYKENMIEGRCMTVLRILKDEHEHSTLVTVNSDGEERIVYANADNPASEYCLNSVIAELVECDPEDNVLYTVTTEGHSIIEGIQKAKRTKAWIKTENNFDPVEITFFNLN